MTVTSTTRKAAGALVIAALLITLPACTRGSRDLEAWVAEVKARPAPPLDPQTKADLEDLLARLGFQLGAGPTPQPDVPPPHFRT